MADKIEWHPNGTPGPWEREADNKVCRQISGELHAICTDQFCYAPEHEKETNARAIAEVPAMVQGYREFPDRADFGHSDEYANAVDVWYSDYAKPILARIDGEATNAPL